MPHPSIFILWKHHRRSLTGESSGIPSFLLVLIMVQRPWQDKPLWPITYQNLQLNQVHRLDTFIKKKKCFILSHFLMFNKILGNMLFVRLKNDTHAQYHQNIGSQIRRVRKRWFSVQYTGDPKTAVTGSWLEKENRSSSGHVRSAHMLLCSCSSSVLSSQPFTQCTVWVH